MYFLEHELLTYKLYKKVINGTFIGPYTEDFTYISTKKGIGVNNRKEEQEMFFSPLFVVKGFFFEKWREVQHYGITQDHGTSINDTIHESFKTISYSNILYIVTLCYGAEVATIRDHKSVFNQMTVSFLLSSFMIDFEMNKFD